MSEKMEEQSGSKKTKKMEKAQQQPVTNREYLDMDTDEEEFGKQETPEPEEELEIEPDKPVFTEEELNILIEYVKDLTTLCDLEASSWSCDVVETIAEYFRNPAKTVLTIFRECNILRSRLDFPDSTSGGLTYFLRSSWQVYTPENFLSTVIFGSVDERTENSTLKFMENLYAPIAFGSNDWPTVTRNEVFSNLHEFLMCLTDATYDPMGLTILYVPREGLEDETKKNAFLDEIEMEGLIERLERVARYWIRQIREAISGIRNKSAPSIRKTIADEIIYWNYKYENLSCVYDQLLNKSVKLIIEKLERVRSASVSGYRPLLSEVHRLLEEAASNITYLNLLEESSEPFSIPDGVEKYARRILLLIRFIGTKSVFYRGKDNIEGLCSAFGTQAVEHLQHHVDLGSIFDGDPENGKKTVLECIECCERIFEVYDKIVCMDELTDAPVISLTDKNKVFSHVHTFVQRCGDLIGICDSRLIFDKAEESIIIFGPKDNEFGKLYRNVEEHFRATLNEIKNSKEDVLDTLSGRWLKKIGQFNEGIRIVENLVENWINDLFDDILTVEDGIETLYGIQGFKKRVNLRETLNDKWKQIWKIFSEELGSCSLMVNNIVKIPWLPPYSGNAHVIRKNRLYLTQQYKMLIDASDWFDDCDAQGAITKKYERVLIAMKEKEETLFNDWQKYLANEKIDPESAMNETIFVHKAHEKSGFLDINLKMDTLTNIRELNEWTLLNYETKNIFSKNSPKWETLKFRYNKAKTIQKAYNDIFQKSSRSEKIFFANLLKELQETVNPGFEKIFWRSETFDKFFLDCMGATSKIHESFENYRTVEEKIERAITQISTTTLLTYEKSFIEMLGESRSHLEQNRIQVTTQVVKKCETILKLLIQLKQRITMNEAQVFEHWNFYVENKHEKLQNSLIECINCTLKSALAFLRGDFVEDTPFEVEINEPIKKEVEDELLKINGLIFEKEFPKQEYSIIFDTKDVNIFFISINDRLKNNETKNQIKEFFKSLGNK